MSDTPSINELVARDEFETYMKVGGDNGEYTLCGDGFTTFKENKNPKEYTRKYINMKTEKTDITGYSPSVDYTLDTYTDNAVVNDIIDITDKELIGKDAIREFVNVNRWQKDASGKCKAMYRKYAVVPSSKGDGTDALIYSGTLKAASDLVTGTFDLSTKTFAADA